MNISLKKFQKWIQSDNERESLQRFYLAIIIVSLLVASLIGLINYSLGHNLLLVTIISSALFLTNSVLWALERAFMDNFFEKPKKPASKKARNNTLKSTRLMI